MTGPPPPLAAPPHERPEDAEHLRVLAACHYVWAALCLVGACIGVAWPLLFVQMMSKLPMPSAPATPGVPGAPTAPEAPEPPVPGGLPTGAPGAPPAGMPPGFPRDFFDSMATLYLVLGISFAAVALLSAVLSMLTGRALGRRRNRTLCMVASGLACISVPLGTLLGVLTILVLTRESVRRLFDDERPAAR